MLAANGSAVNPPVGNVTHRNDMVTMAVLSPYQQGRYLPERQMALLSYLCGHAGRFVSGWELADAVYGGVGGEAAVRMGVMRLRGRLGDRAIEAVRGLGYRVPASRAAELERVCANCLRPVADYEDVEVCFGCGRTFAKPLPFEGAGDIDVGRAPYKPGSRSGQAWTEGEKEFVRSHMDSLTLEEMGSKLNRSASSVRGLIRVWREAGELEGRKGYVRRQPRRRQ